MGRSKALESICGKSLIQRVIERLKPIGSQIIVVTSEDYFDLAVDPGAETRVDIYPGKGPLGGIYTGLVASESLASLVVACDMPFLNIELIRYMIRLSPGFDAIVPRLERVEPLHAVYSKSLLDAMRSCIEHNQLGVSRFLNTVHTRYVEQAECRRFDPQLLSFFNINSQEDLDHAINLTEEGW